MSEKRDTKFKPGESGNPHGRPKGSGWAGRAREKLQKAWDGEMADGSDGLLKVLIDKAKEGDVSALRLVAERICQPLKAAEPSAELDLTGDTLTQKANSVVTALSAGELSPGQAAQLLTALGALAKVQEVDELTRRIEALEQAKK